MLLHLHFCVNRSSLCQYYEDGRVLVTRQDYSQSFATTSLHYGVCFCVQDAHNAILKALDCLEVRPDDLAECMNGMIREATQLCVNNMRKADYRENCLFYNINLWYEHGLVGERPESMEEDQDDDGMIPAALPAIRALGAKRLDVEDGNEVGQCMVCLEEYSDGEKVSCMPCSHMFHADCITKWLLRSHLCPICKFQMPKCS